MYNKNKTNDILSKMKNKNVSRIHLCILISLLSTSLESFKSNRYWVINDHSVFLFSLAANQALCKTLCRMSPCSISLISKQIFLIVILTFLLYYFIFWLCSFVAPHYYRNLLLPSQPPSLRKLPPRLDLVIIQFISEVEQAIHTYTRACCYTAYYTLYYMAIILRYVKRFVDTNCICGDDDDSNNISMNWYSRKQPRERRVQILLRMETPRQSRWVKHTLPN